MKKFWAQLLILAFLIFGISHLVKGQDVRVQYSGLQTNIFKGILGSSFAGTTGQAYIMAVLPNQSVTWYLSNTAPATQDSITINFFYTGNSYVSNYSSNTNFWLSLSTYNLQTGFQLVGTNVVLGGGRADSISFTSGITNALQVVIVLSGGTGAAPLNLDVSLTPNGGFPANLIQGVLPNGTNGTVNPIIIGVLDQNGNARTLTTNFNGGTNYVGLMLGTSGGIPNTPSTTSFMTTGAGIISTLATQMYGYSGGSLLSAPLYVGAQSPGSGSIGGSLLTLRGGEYNSNNFGTVTASTTKNIFSTTQSGNLQAFNGLPEGCNFELAVTGTVSGSSPTLNVYIQTSDDGTNWNDRVSFIQVTSSPKIQEAAINASSLAPTNFASNTLTAGSILNGVLGPYVRTSLVVGGSSPSFSSVVVYGQCY